MNVQPAQQMPPFVGHKWVLMGVLSTQRAQWNLNKIEITLNGTFAG